MTGTNSGVGKEVAQILYQKNAKVYVAARSEEKAQEAIQAIKESYQQSKGDLVFLRLDLGDLATIKASVNEFLSREKKLHVLFNNAGVMWPPQGSKTAQGYELQLGTNNLGTFLFTKLLTPTLVSTARSESPSTVRVVWVSSSATEMSPKPGGIPMGNLDYHEDQSAQTKYAVSKAGNYLHSTEFAKRYKQDGVVSVALNPGNLETGLQRHVSPFQRWLINLILYPAKYGAYTELFAGISSEVTIDRTGQWSKWAPAIRLVDNG